MRSDEFLKLFRVLEDVLEAKYSGKHRSNSSIVIEYLQDSESLPWRDQLDLCREVRNILTHKAEMDGEPVVEPAKALIDMLGDIIEYAKRPPLALEFATPKDQILTADLGQRVMEVMRAMEKRGFSHVPVIQRGELIGVFSTGCVFSYIIRNLGENEIDKNLRVRDFLPWLPIDRHVSEGYGFIDSLATYADVKSEFERIKRSDKRLAVLFVTQNGQDNEPLLGMITPWDVLGKR